jgi:hypothetical protein
MHVQLGLIKVCWSSHIFCHCSFLKISSRLVSWVYRHTPSTNLILGSTYYRVTVLIEWPCSRTCLPGRSWRPACGPAGPSGWFESGSSSRSSSTSPGCRWTYLEATRRAGRGATGGEEGRRGGDKKGFIYIHTADYLLPNPNHNY